jgi:glycosyltransferase involved in cell wall biosynthesis
MHTHAHNRSAALPGSVASAEDAALPASGRADLTVLIPVFNERENLLHILERVRAVDVRKEIIIVDDASTDGTRELLRAEVEGRYPDVRVLYHERNQGKGMCIRTALASATGRVTIIQDGDLEYVPEDYHAILAPFADPEVSAVYGSRFLNGWPKMRPANRLVNRLLAWMVRTLFRAPMTDEATCYKAFRTEVLQGIPLTCRRFEFCPEVTAKALRRGHRIVEVPIHYEARSMAQGKKIRWTDGVAAIWTLLKFRFVRF